VSALLPTRLPLTVAGAAEVSADTFNRLVRILEINLGGVDFSISPHFNSTELAELQFATGAIIFNTTTEVHQAFDGVQFRNLYEHQTYASGLGIASGVGTVTVSTP
tara:strand:+ start:955 stop:1272 length:318 start_codon:yes stop_codon:yes gene_type:complete